MESRKAGNIIRKFWHEEAGRYQLNKEYYHLTSKAVYIYRELGVNNGRLMFNNVTYNSFNTIWRIPAIVDNVVMFMFKTSINYICILFYEIGTQELHVYRYRGGRN